MRSIVTDGVAWYVRLSVCHDREPCKNCRTDRDAVWVVDSGGPKEQSIDVLDEGPDPPMNGELGEGEGGGPL